MTSHSSREQILEAAAAVWNEKGYTKSTLRDIALRLRMNVNDLYPIFQSKEEIVLYLYNLINERSVEAFYAQDQQEADLGRNLKTFLQFKLSLLEPYRASCVGIFQEAIDPRSSLNPFNGKNTTIVNKGLHLFQDLLSRSEDIAEHISKRSLKSMGRGLWMLHLGIILYWLHDRSEKCGNTFRLIDKVAPMSELLPLMASQFEAGDFSDLFTALFQEESPDFAHESKATDHKLPVQLCDIMVIGGGPIGLLYASWVKSQRPLARVLVLEQSEEPGHKIGESTLSGFCKALRSLGIPHAAMQRLFYPKNGLGFMHVTESTFDITQAEEYILETFDETFQVERRVLDSLILANARRIGVEVQQKASVDVSKSTFSEGNNQISYNIGHQSFCVNAALVVDASGPNGLLSRHFKVNSKEGLTFQTSAVWAYFKNVRPLASYQNWKNLSQFPRDQYTEHLCFKEGWMWYIPIVSWQDSPSGNLNRLLNRTLESEGELPERSQLVQDYGCPNNNIVSIGIVVRSDRDRLFKEDPHAAFEAYRKKYPAINQVLEGAELLTDYYGPSQTVMSRSAFRTYSRQVVGDGWLLVGDASFFVDPLISPGLTGGTCQAYKAAQATIRALDNKDFSKNRFSEYETFSHQLHDALERDNQLVYMSFNHPEAMSIIQRFQEIFARQHFIDFGTNPYDDNDTNIWGILTPEYQDYQKRIWAIMRDEEQSVTSKISIEDQVPEDYEPMVQRLHELLGPFLNEQKELTPYVIQNTLEKV